MKERRVIFVEKVYPNTRWVRDGAGKDYYLEPYGWLLPPKPGQLLVVEPTGRRWGGITGDEWRIVDEKE